RDYISWGQNLEPLAGICALTGYADGPPSGSPIALPDWAAALHGLSAIMAALIRRARSGEGQFIEMSQLESAVALIEPAVMRYFATGEEQPRIGNRHPAAAPHGAFPCRSATPRGHPSPDLEE